MYAACSRRAALHLGSVAAIRHLRSRWRGRLSEMRKVSFWLYERNVSQLLFAGNVHVNKLGCEESVGILLRAPCEDSDSISILCERNGGWPPAGK